MFANPHRNNRVSRAGDRRGISGASKAGTVRHFRPQLEALEDRTLMTVNIVHNFPDINFQDAGGFTPPDTMMAGGPTAVVGAVNTAITLKSKTGMVLAAPEQFSTFFASI